MEPTMEMMCFFSGPKWHWTATKNGFELGEVNNKVELEIQHGKKTARKNCLVDIPTEFFKLFHDVIAPQEDYSDVHFRVIQVPEEKRYYFFVTWVDAEGERVSLPLWYWVPSNMPKWVRAKHH